MKAGVVCGTDEIKWTDWDTPIVGPKDVLMRVRATGICGTDLELFHGIMPYITLGLMKHPFVPGHEWAGEVVEVGSEVTGFAAGDRVTGDVSIACDECFYCLTGKYNLCTSKTEVGCWNKKPGSFAEYLTMPAKHVYELPDSISFEEGAMVEPAATAVHTVECADISLGDTVVVQGDGPIGLLSLQAARAAGAAEVVLVGTAPSKLDLGGRLGADVTINADAQDPVERVMDLTSGVGAHVVIEASGVPGALDQTFRMARDAGHVSLVGIYTDVVREFDMNQIVFKMLSVRGVLASPGFFPATLSLMASGALRTKELISHRFALGEVEAAMKVADTQIDERIKIMLTAED